MKNLENVKQQRLSNLANYFPDIRKGYQWLVENRSKFKGRVYEPAVLLLNLKDPKYASQVEYAMGGFRSGHLRVSLLFCLYK